MKSADPIAPVLKALNSALIRKGDPERAAIMSRYMKGRFVYFGVVASERKIIFRSFKNEFLDLVKHGYLEEILIRLWDFDEREMQYIAMELLDVSRKYYAPAIIDLIERLILSKSWWDTVDMLAGKSAGYAFLKFPELRLQRIKDWIKHPDFWLNRSAMIHQLTYKNKTDFDLLKTAILPHMHSKEFFLQKAIGWALRQYSKTDPKAVLKYVGEHPELSRLSKKEALRLMQKQSNS